MNTDLPVFEHQTSAGYIVRYGKSPFNHPNYPNRPLSFVQFRNGIARIVDSEIACPDYIELLGADNIKVPYIREGELVLTGKPAGYWWFVSWASIQFDNCGESKLGEWQTNPYSNSKIWVNALDTSDKFTPPNVEQALRRIRASQAAVRKAEQHWTKKVVRWLSS